MELPERNGAPFTISTTDVSSTKTTYDSREILATPKKEKSSGGGHGMPSDHPTSFMETLMHLLRGNIGAGVFAMGDAFKNGGLILATVLTIFLGVVCVHSQHILLKCSRRMKEKVGREEDPDFAETVELCFENGPPSIRKWSPYIKILVNIFICTTQMGFCCIYFVFISSSLKQVLDFYGWDVDVHIHMLLILVPMLLPSLITNLKYLAPCSSVANICMATGIGVVFYYAFQELPHPSERNYVGELSNIPLFFGTAIFAFEGIALVLPLKNAMLLPNTFGKAAGVLNIGMVIVTTLYTFFGFFGYLKWGEEVAGSLTLSLPPADILAQVVKLTVSVGMLLTFPLQFFIPIQITWPIVYNKIGPFQRPVLAELIYRTILVILIFSVASIVPKLNLFISLIGALCSTALALVFPPVIQLISAWGTSEGPTAFVLIKDLFIVLVGLLGFSTGTYESLAALIAAFSED